MRASDDSQPPARDVDGSEDPEEDPGEELEAMIEQADRPFAATRSAPRPRSRRRARPSISGWRRNDRPGNRSMSRSPSRTSMLPTMRSSWWAGLRSSTTRSSHLRRQP